MRANWVRPSHAHHSDVPHPPFGRPLPQAGEAKSAATQFSEGAVAKRRMLAAFLGDFAMRRIAIAVCTVLSFAAHAGDRITGKTFATRSAVIAQHGMVATPAAGGAGRAGRAEKGRQRRRCGHRRQRRARRGGADVVRHRRRPVRHRLGRQDAEALRPQRQRPLAAIATLAVFARTGPEGDPRARAASWSVPGCVDGWDALHKRFGTLLADRLLAPAHRLRRGGLPRERDHRRRLATRRCRACRSSRTSPSSLPARRPRARGRRGLPKNPNLGATRCRRSPRAAATPSTRADRRTRSSRTRRRTAASFARRTSPATRATGSSRSRRTTAATTSGSCRRTARGSPRCRCSTCSKRYDLKKMGPQSPDYCAPARRGEEARLRGPGEVLRRPGVRQGAGRPS